MVALAISAILLCACTAGKPAPSASTASRPTATVTPTPTPIDPIAHLSLEQRVGQLFMVGTQATAADPRTLSAITNLHVGNVFLAGRSHVGAAATAPIVGQFTALVTTASTGGIPLAVATDQEGGEVQVLQGPGFSEIPSALQQGTLAPAALQQDATTWGAELKSAGLNMNLAPVVGLIASPQAAENNPPIGGFDRQFGYDPTQIVQHADAFRAGMAASGITSVVKHFPGLGAVTENTDTSSGVTDTTTTADGPAVGVFASEIKAGARCIMVSSAIYANLDPNAPAVFSPAVTTTLLRQKLGFDGVVMTDDLSAAAQVQGWSPADRAVLAIAAGADIVLDSADPSIAPEMVQAVVAKASADATFRAQVDAAARRVVVMKLAG